MTPNLPPAGNVRLFKVRRWTTHANVECHGCRTPIPPGGAKSPSPHVEIVSMDLQRLVLCTGCAPSAWEGAELAYGRAACWTPRDGWNRDPASDAVAAAERITRTEANHARSEALIARHAAGHELHRRKRARRAKDVTEARAAAAAGALGLVPTDVRLAARALNVLDELRSMMVTAEADGFYDANEQTPLRDVDDVYVADEAQRWANRLLLRWHTGATTPHSDA